MDETITSFRTLVTLGAGTGPNGFSEFQRARGFSILGWTAIKSTHVHGGVVGVSDACTIAHSRTSLALGFQSKITPGKEGSLCIHVHT